MDRYIEILLAITLTLLVVVLFIIVSMSIGFILQASGVVNLPWLDAFILLIKKGINDD